MTKKNQLFLHFSITIILPLNLKRKAKPSFKPGDSCINKLITITHEIYKSFHDKLEIYRVYLDIS